MNEYLNFPGKELNVPIIQSNNFFKKKQRNQSQRFPGKELNVPIIQSNNFFKKSEDSGFNSYPNLPEVYLVKNVVR